MSNQHEEIKWLSDPEDKDYTKATQSKTYKLLTAQGTEIETTAPGTIGGHRQLRIYGKLDCPSARSYINKGKYIQHRVFFADETTAIAAGYRPCAKCMKQKYDEWKLRHV